MSNGKGSGLSEQQQKTIAIVGFALLFVGILGYQLRDIIFGPSTPPPPAAPVIVSGNAPKTATTQVASNKGVSTPPGYVVGGAATAQKVGTTNGQLDPTLHEDAMHVTEALVYSGNGRNIFGLGPAVVEVAQVKPIAPARPLIQQPVVAPVVYTGPPPPPPIDLKFFGTATAANGSRRAFLLHGEDVFLASDGDIVQRRYKVIAILANSITVEDMPNNNKQTLPLQAN